MKISVAMCTYNGAANLPDQLVSIAAQSRLPHELVVCDDRSDDDTASVVEAFAAEAPFPVRLVVNDENLGVARNFGKAIALCTGEAIALSDQDDVWLPEKLAALAAALAESPGAAMVFTDAELVDEDLRPLGYRLWPSAFLGPRALRRIRRGEMLDVLLTRNVCTGATMGFRSEYRDLLLPISPGWVHDGWIALLLAAVADVVAVDQPLIRYRQHGRQQIGARKPALYRQYRKAKAMQLDYFTRQTANYEAALERLSGFGRVPLRPGTVHKLRSKVAHCRQRLRMRQVGHLRRLPLILKETLRGRYFRYSINWKAIPQDLLL